MGIVMRLLWDFEGKALEKVYKYLLTTWFVFCYNTITDHVVNICIRLSGMKREEKNLQSRQKIMDAAWKEFGEKSYAEASLNTICKEGDISKGIIYHYFKDKDELYSPDCWSKCLCGMILLLRRRSMSSGSIRILLIPSIRCRQSIRWI